MAEIVMDITGIPGETTADQYEGKIAVTSIGINLQQVMDTSVNATRTVHTINVEDVQISRPFDKSSIPLIDKLVTASNLGQVKLHCLKAAGDSNAQICYMTYILHDVLIASYSISDDGSGAPTENLGLSFTKIEWQYKPQKQDGTLEGGQLVTNFNVLKGKKE